MTFSKLAVAFSLVLLGTLSVAAQENAVEAEITKTVLNYAEGWYEGDGAKMESALHPDLAKRTVETNAQGRSRLNELSAMGLVQVTRPGYGKNTPKDQQMKDVKILDKFGDMATVRLEMRDWIDYMHLAKFNGKWVIVNVLWKGKPHDADGER